MPTRILLAETDDVLRASLAEQLEREGYEVTAAKDGDGAQACAREQMSFAIVGLADGEQVAAGLRGQGLGCPILLLIEDEVPSAFETLTRPFRFSALLARLHALNNHHAPGDDAAVR